MFELTTTSEPVIVDTFELDLRMGNATDLAVEIYTLQGTYADFFNQSEEWTLIADTEVVLSAGGGGIVPVHRFTPVRIDVAQRQSFYITMKGPYLDHKVNALQKTGEVQSVGDDLQIFVGSGLTAYKFPNQLDKVLHPMFSGVIHYARSYDCDTVVTSTTVFEFPILFRDSVGNMADVTKAISDALDELITRDPQLSSFVSDFSLVKQKGETEALTYTRKYHHKPRDLRPEHSPSHYCDFQLKHTLFIAQKLAQVPGMIALLLIYTPESISCMQTSSAKACSCTKFTSRRIKSWSLCTAGSEVVRAFTLAMRVWPLDSPSLS